LALHFGLLASVQNCLRNFDFAGLLELEPSIGQAQQGILSYLNFTTNDGSRAEEKANNNNFYL